MGYALRVAVDYTGTGSRDLAGAPLFLPRRASFLAQLQGAGEAAGAPPVRVGFDTAAGTV